MTIESGQAGGQLMHVHKTLTDPFEVDEDDPELLGQ